MSVILLVVGIVITVAGVVTIGFGVPINESALGQTLIMAGATGLVGGPLVIAVAAAVSQLSQILAALKGRPAVAARPAEAKQAAAEVRRKADAPAPEPRVSEPRAPEPRVPEPRVPEPRAVEPRPGEPAPAATIDVSASAIERLRSTMPRPGVVTQVEEVPPLSPNGAGHPPPEPLPEPKPEPRPAVVEAREPREPRLDFLFRGRNQKPAQPESFDAMWPKRGGRGEPPKPDQVKSDEVARQPAPPPPAPAEERRTPAPPVAAEEPRSVAILKSGVVDGMAYTLYADGSIEAQLPHGTVRFGSIAELRSHIENNS
jgi:hypothetical protein